MFGDIFIGFPTVAVFLVSAALFFAASEIGFRIGRAVRRRREHLESGSTGIVTGSILGLVSFLLAFSFGIASSNFSDRRAVVLDEANAIGTAYLRADLLVDAAAAERLKAMLREYTQVRVSVPHHELTYARYVEIVEASERLQSEIWTLVAQQARAQPSPSASLVVSAVNEVIDLHAVRVALGVRHAIPDIIWIALYTISALALGTTGYRFGASYQARSELLPGMVFAFTCIISLIADLDNPRRGFLLGDQTAMTELAESFGRHGN